jgi:chromate reductase
MRLVGIAGSLRSGSHNRELLRLTAEQAPVGVELVEWDGLVDVPPYDPDREVPEPTAVSELRSALRDADGVLFATPEYNASIPGALKNAIDWLSRPSLMAGPLWGKPVAVVSASTGSFGAIWAQTELNKVLRAVGARVVETGLAVAKADARLVAPDVELLDDLRRVLELVAVEAGAGGEAAAAGPALRQAQPAASRAAA